MPLLVDVLLDCLPRQVDAANGLPVELRLLPADDGPRLVDMYLDFQPRNSFQGLPPLKDAACIKWVEQMLDMGVNVVALAHRVSLIGHAALFPVDQRKCEMLVVVCPGFQNIGVGSQLMRACIDVAYELGFQQISLPVDATNVRARHLYEKCGFEYTSDKQARELEMACDVTRCRTAPKAARLPCAAPYIAVPSLDPAVPSLDPAGLSSSLAVDFPGR